MNIPDTTRNQTTIYVPGTPNVCFCTTWRKQNKQNITFLVNAISFLIKITHIWHILSSDAKPTSCISVLSAPDYQETN